ncbi:MAG: hypothetical protein IJ864_05385 [Alphaproteobacteria bacterium]|nr:hypothetical protein [Alphaproteobacteria bacterium]
MSTLNKEDLERLQEAKQRQYQESKLELDINKVSIREFFQKYGNMDERLVSRELVVETGHGEDKRETVVFGIEYDQSGQVGAIYQQNYKEPKRMLKIEDLVETNGAFKKFVNERMEYLLGNMQAKKEKVRANTSKEAPARKKVVVRKVTPTLAKERDTHSI